MSISRTSEFVSRRAVLAGFTGCGMAVSLGLGGRLDHTAAQKRARPRWFELATAM